jgi:prepilin-type N-terminal cleavage/methylation domain-containing protein
MKTLSPAARRGFSLIETVIAIGVVAVLLTGFLVVFTPAAQGIRRSISVQEADRLASTVEQELVTFRTGDPGGNGFGKAFDFIKDSNSATTALLVYQYRGSLGDPRPDGTPKPVANPEGKSPGKDYTVTTMVRRKNDTKFLEDLPALEGGVHLVKCTQLVFSGSELRKGTRGQIRDPKSSSGDSTATDYPEAVIAFAADFYTLPGNSKDYFGAPFTRDFARFTKPVFTRNLAVRR